MYGRREYKQISTYDFDDLAATLDVQWVNNLLNVGSFQQEKNFL